MNDIMEKAIRDKVRFKFHDKLLFVVDLWDLSVKQLDIIFGDLNRSMAAEESLINDKSKYEEGLEFGIDIVKYIVATKVKEDKVADESEHTDLEKYVELYRCFGIECIVECNEEHMTSVITLGTDSHSTCSDKFNGYTDFFTSISFDENGKFKGQGFYE